MTYVCQYFRKSLISTPSVWARISNYEPIRTAELSLERCKAASLELCLDLGVGANSGFPGVSTEFSNLIKPHIQNIRVLQVRFGLFKEGFPQKLQDCFPSMPNLRSLSLIANTQPSTPWQSDDPCDRLTSPLTYLCLERIPLYPSLLRLRTLTNLRLLHYPFDHHLDVLLDFLEQNSSLEYADLMIQFTEPSFRDSQRRVPIKTRLRRLSISSWCSIDTNALINKIPIHGGTSLTVDLSSVDPVLEHIPCVVSSAGLHSSRSPTFMGYKICAPVRMRVIKLELCGPNVNFSLSRRPTTTENRFFEFPLFPLNSIRTFHLQYDDWSPSPVFPPLFFPALETLVVECEVDMSRLFSNLFSNPSSSPSLKTLVFLRCLVKTGFMEKLILFSSHRKNTTSTCLHRVVIVHSGMPFDFEELEEVEGVEKLGELEEFEESDELPPSALIDQLRDQVTVVDVGPDLPPDLKYAPVGWRMLPECSLDYMHCWERDKD